MKIDIFEKYIVLNFESVANKINELLNFIVNEK